MLITERKLRNLISTLIKESVNDVRYKKYYDASYKEEKGLPDDPEAWPEDHKKDSKLNKENIKKELAKHLPTYNIKFISVSIDTDYVNIIVNTSFFKSMTVSIFLPKLQANAYEIYNKRYKYNNRLDEIFDYIFEPIQVYSAHYNQMLMSDRVEKMLEYAVGNGYPEADRDFARTVDKARNGAKIILGTGKMGPTRGAYQAATDTFYNPEIMLDDRVVFHELGHRHRHHFTNFNKKMKNKVIREGDILYDKKKEGSRKDNVNYRGDPLAELFPILNNLDTLSGFVPSLSGVKEGEIAQYKEVIRRLINDPDNFSFVDLNVKLPPIDFNIANIKKMYSKIDSGEYKDDHDHDHPLVTLYNLKQDHITETIQRLGMYADNEKIDISSKEKAGEYIENWLAGKYDKSLEYSENPYHELAGLGMLIKNTDKSINWFVTQLISTVKSDTKKQKDTVTV